MQRWLGWQLGLRCHLSHTGALDKGHRTNFRFVRPRTKFSPTSPRDLRTLEVHDQDIIKYIVSGQRGNSNRVSSNPCNDDDNVNDNDKLHQDKKEEEEEEEEEEKGEFKNIFV